MSVEFAGQRTGGMLGFGGTGFDGWIHLENDYQVDAASRPEAFDYKEAIQKDAAALKAVFG